MIPEKLQLGKLREFDIGVIVAHYEKYKSNGPGGLVDTCSRYVCGYPVPEEVQRALQWTPKQKTSFIESLFLGYLVDPVSIHARDWEVGGEVKRFSGWCLDGQNRLDSIECYVENKFPVFDLYYRDLSKRDVRRFLKIKFSHLEVELWDIDAIRDFYTRKAFGGTPHT